MRGFERRIAERSKRQSEPSDTERALRDAETRVRNLTSAIAKRPELEALYDQLANEQATVKRLRAELVDQRPAQAPRVAPSKAQVREAVSMFLGTLGTAAPGEGREILAQICTPITVARNAEAPGAYSATGALRLATVVAKFRSGGSTAQPAGRRDPHQVHHLAKRRVAYRCPSASFE